MPRVLIPMADYGHDPAEVAVPYTVFKEADFTVEFVPEKGISPRCDSKMLEGLTGAILGANCNAKKAYRAMASTASSWQKPLAWTDAGFSMDKYDLVFLPGGHDRGVRQLIDSEIIHEQLANFFPKARAEWRGR